MLAEIVAEGERLEAAVRAAHGSMDAIHASDSVALYYAVHGPRLLAVSKAAQWVADDMRYRAPEQAAGLYRSVWLDHLDAAASGAAEGEK